MNPNSNLKQISLIALLTFSAGISQAEDASQVVDALTGKAISTIESGINEFANDVANSFGNGNTEISISNIESGNPSYSIKTIQPLTSPNKDTKELIFTQGSLTSGENEGDRRATINLGLGKRILVEDDKAIVGANVFVDYETSSKHKRTSLGLEYQRSNFSATANKYWALSDKVTINGNTEEALSGHDINLTGQMPYTPWATIKGTHYYWDQKTGDNINGNILGIEIELSPSTSFEIGSENSNTMNRTAYAELSVKLPFVGNDTLNTFQLDDTPFRADADMSLELLAMVERSNKIKIEKLLSNDDVITMTAGGVTYSTVTIGTQTWTVNNMAHAPSNGSVNTLNTHYWDSYSGSHGSGDATDEDGYYYTWDAAMNNSTTEEAQGICASGWHIPDDNDWATLEEAAVAGASGVGWLTTELGDSRGNDEGTGTSLKEGGTSGFEAKLAGYRSGYNGNFYARGDGVYLWSSTESDSKAYVRDLDRRVDGVARDTYGKTYGFSVRCLKN